MTDPVMIEQTEDKELAGEFTDELSDEALDREEAMLCLCPSKCG
jgi:hypothetical protein